jgi:hypothetical protein
MICTEEEARKKWCPMARGIDHSDQCYAIPWLPCAASNCMMWRWGEEETECTFFDPQDESWKFDPYLSGIGIKESRWSRAKTERKGYCGLGAKP